MGDSGAVREQSRTARGAAMRLAELQQALRAADPAAVLVPPRVLERILQQLYQLSGLFAELPHRKTLVIERSLLYRHVDQDDLDLEPDRLLPSVVILLARPLPNLLGNLDRETVLLEYWRLLFHAAVHRELDRRVADGRLTPEQVQARIETIGTSEFAEIRMVLEQERYLLPARRSSIPDRETPTEGATAVRNRAEEDLGAYIEFAAVYLQLRAFARNLLPVYFPGLTDTERIDRLLAQDVDADALFAGTRLAGAPDPVVRTDTKSDESHDYYYRLTQSADDFEAAGNTVRAAILRTRAVRVASPTLAEQTRLKVRADLRRLTARLQAALELSDAEAAEWLKVLPALLDKADQGTWPSEAALLYDLQKVGVDHERDIYALDLVEWVRSAGRRPIKRPLPSEKIVRVTRHLRSAAQRLTMARLSDEDRQHLGRLLQEGLDGCEGRLRARFRPVLTDALLSVGLQPNNPAERTALAKMVEEMLDRISELGFLTFSDLRDCVSRNQLKMPDLADPQEFIRGDPLLRLDRRLATALDGVYRPGEFYLRWLERFTAPGFGTSVGRWVIRFLVLPFGGALVLLQALHMLLRHLGPGPVPPFDPASAFESLRGSEPAFPTLGVATFLGTGFFLFGLMHVAAVRRGLRQGLLLSYKAARALFVDMPAWVLRRPWLRALWESWPFQLFWSFGAKPAAVCAVLWACVPETRSWVNGVIAFVAVNFLLNSRMGRAVGDVVMQSLVDFYELLRAGLLPGLFRLILSVFKRINETMEYVLHTVEDRLRFRKGESQTSMVVRTIAGLFWYPVAALTRFYLVVLVEPMLNPIKLPLSILAAKFVYPMLLALGWFDVVRLDSPFINNLSPYLGRPLAWLLVVSTFYLLPDAVTFLVWEMKENWGLYRANRRAVLRPVVVGTHGETVRQLLQPGFHSGTVPKLFARLRLAEREGIRTGNWRAARTCRHALEGVQKTLQRLVARELLPLLEESPRWKGPALAVGAVSLTPNRIRIELEHPEYAGNPVRMVWEEQAGWLVAGVRSPGWLESLSPEQRQAVTTGLAGLYKLAGIDLVQEQVQRNLPAPAVCWDLTPHDLVVWADQRHGSAVLYDLGAPAGPLKPRTPDGAAATGWPPLDPTRILFARVPLTWQQWVASWQAEPAGKAPLLTASVQLLPDSGLRLRSASS
jgi:hypothetical protein